MASLVEFAPVPAMIGISPAAYSNARSMTFLCSEKLKVDDSPVVPTTTIAFVLLKICHLINFSKQSQSTSNDLGFMGVIRATRLPVIINVIRDLNAEFQYAV